MTKPFSNGWQENANADNSLATATHAADTRQKHVLTKVFASYDGPGASGLLEIKAGAVVKYSQVVHDEKDVLLEFGEIVSALNETISAELAASGTAGIFGRVTIMGVN